MVVVDDQVPGFAQSHPHARWVQRKRPLWFGPWWGDSNAGAGTTAFIESFGPLPLEYAQLWSCLAGPENPEEMFIVVPEDWGT